MTEAALAAVEAWDAKSRRATTPSGAGQMVWRVWGEGPPVVLLHGGAGSWRHWIRNLEALTARHRVLAPDSPGLGESAAPSDPWTPHASAEAVATGLRTLLLPEETVDIVGFSAGAILGGLIARLLGARCRTLVLVGAGGLGTARVPVALEKVRRLEGDARREAHFTNLARLMIADPERIDEQAIAIQAWNSDHTRISSVAVAQSDILARALEGGAAALKAIWGEADAVARTSLDDRCGVLRAIDPAVEIAVLPGAGHWVAYEAADRFNETLLRMLVQ
jgi:pimeloyl-ACP methyl ester carboxylesterase